MTIRAKPITRASRVGWSNWLVLGEALAALAGASAAIRLLPFRRIIPFRDGLQERTASGPEHQRRVAIQCRWAIEKWSAKVPWRTVCFQKGLALHAMLRRRNIPSVLHYGVAQDSDKGLTAHVWISLRGEIILGGEVAADYTCLATYPGQQEQ